LRYHLRTHTIQSTGWHWFSFSRTWY